MARRLHTRRRWTKHQVRALSRLYPNTLTAKIAKRFGRPVHQVHAKAVKLGLRKSAEFFASGRGGRWQPGIGGGLSGRFQKGQVPANKGLRRPGWHRGRMKETQFKRGQISTRWDQEVYCVGALRITSDGQLDIKVQNGPRGWRAMARWVWATENGPIPKGMVVRAKNGDGHDTRVENLRLATRVELMQENTIHNYPEPIARLVQLRGALNRQINRREEQRAEDA